jgi:hypothetical protein
MTEYGPNFFRKYLDILEAPQLTPAQQNLRDAGQAAMMVGTQRLNKELGSPGAKNLPGVTTDVQAQANKNATELQNKIDKAKATPGPGVGSSLRGMDVNKKHGGEDGADLDNLGGKADPANVSGTAANQKEIDWLRGKK